VFTFITAYVFVWLAALGYLLRLGSEQRRLRRMAEALQKQLEQKRAARRQAA
jgi:CcmD family protein